jgi:hypothetical protein
MSIRRFAWIGLVLALAGCGAAEGPTTTASAVPSPTVASALPSATASATTIAPSPTPEYTGITNGIVVAGCMQRGDVESIQVVQFDETAKMVRTVVFNEPTDGATYRSHAQCGSNTKRSAFNQDFTRLFVSREESKTSTTPGGAGIG